MTKYGFWLVNNRKYYCHRFDSYRDADRIYPTIVLLNFFCSRTKECHSRRKWKEERTILPLMKPSFFRYITVQTSCSRFHFHREKLTITFLQGVGKLRQGQDLTVVCLWCRQEKSCQASLGTCPGYPERGGSRIASGRRYVEGLGWKSTCMFCKWSWISQ